MLDSCPFVRFDPNRNFGKILGRDEPRPSNREPITFVVAGCWVMVYLGPFLYCGDYVIFSVELSFSFRLTELFKRQ